MTSRSNFSRLIIIKALASRSIMRPTRAGRPLSKNSSTSCYKDLGRTKKNLSRLSPSATRTNFSSSAVVVVSEEETMYNNNNNNNKEEEDKDDDNELPKVAAQRKVETSPTRTRLTELRRQLQRQDARDLDSFQPTNKQQSQQQSQFTKSKSNTSTTLRLPNRQDNNQTTTTTTAGYTRDDWLALVDSLPDIPSSSSSSSHALTDRFDRRHTYLRLSLAERCNLRCTYCMPADGVPLQPAASLLQTDELLHLARFFRQAGGVDKFRLTGGEPTLRADLVDIVTGLQALEPRQVGMTTNGVALANKIPALVAAGLDSINVSLDTLHPQKFEQLTRRPAAYLRKVMEALEAAYQHMPAPSQIKINCVLMRHVNTEEVADFITLGLERFPGIAVRFIEYMPFTDNGWQLDKLVPYKEVLQDIEQRCASQQVDWQITKALQTDPHDTTQWYQATSSHDSDAHVKVGFITSMSRPFCAGCNRLRLSADGQLKVCLFGSTPQPQHHDETTMAKPLPSLWSLRDALRVGQLDDAQLSKLVHAALQTKSFALGGHDSPQTIHEHARENKPMTLIGG